MAPDILPALDCLRVAITLLDASERLTYCSQHFNYLFRALPNRESLIGRSYEELIRMELACRETKPEGAQDAEAYIAHRRAQLRAGEYAPRDIELANGRIVEVKARQTPEGGWIVLWSDATHARHLLRRLETAVDLSADAFAFWDSGDRLILCSDLFAELHGYHSPDQMLGEHFRDIVVTAVRRDRFKIEGEVEKWIERRVDTHDAPAGALTLITHRGAAFLVRDRATGDGGRATVFTDVTERHRAERALAEQSTTLERTNKALKTSEFEARRQAKYLSDLTRRLGAAEAEADTAKTALMRAMSHELKTPLNAILGFSDLLRVSADRFSQEQISEYAGLIHMAGGNLLKLINQILDLTKIAANRYPLRRRALPAGASLWAAADAYISRAAEKNIKLEIADCETDLMVDADENALNGMIGQLIENAITFTQSGGHVRVSAARQHGIIRFVVADNGPGVPPEDLHRIQQPFEQAGRGITDHTQGAGLGLPLAQGLAELHGGKLTVASVFGEGFTARLELPSA
ncbi:MAG: PAS-domain containing protein [Proteobacteria bacterium]|nr:PAS-domain containing protein [Pseudomonadota bacterium]